MITRSVLDTRYLAIPVTATVNGQSVDPSSDVVQFAFMPAPPGANPGSGDWHTGTWATSASGGHLAQCLIGPANGALTLPTGTYQVWLKVTDSPEVPVIPVDYLQIT